MPDFARVAEAMGFKVITINTEAAMETQLAAAYAHPGPVFCNVEINPSQKLYPVLKFGAALENQLPALADQLIDSEMLVPRYQPTAAAGAPLGTAGV